ncbi:MAG: MFS transporter [Cytophagaceae bacterium]|nr:MAG: MFS transporter [Cytophagaceae bacterium]
MYDKPSRRKNRAFGCFSAGNPLGFVFGTILSGLFTQIFNWRAGFFLIAITYLVTSIVAFVTVPTDTMPKQTVDRETLRKLDLPGTGMTIAGIGMFCAALSLAGDAPNGWKTPRKSSSTIPASRFPRFPNRKPSRLWRSTCTATSGAA